MTQARLRAVAALAVATAAACSEESSDAAGPGTSAATYVGAARCESCHPNQTRLWRESDHARAMAAADPARMLGDFHDATFAKDGVTTTFRARDGRFVANAEDADGRMRDFTISHAFGVDPLQQYLVELPGGRFQALDLAWDARPIERGGQRWIDLHPGERIPAGDVLHWTGPALNWNHACADCHSTDVAKNWRAESGRFETSYAEVNVACEACHGPGSRHVELAEAARGGAGAAGGLAVTLRRDAVAWSFPPGEPIARRKTPLGTQVEVETCGRCHARRAQIWDEIEPGALLSQAFRVALLEPGLYHADGTIQDEVYEYGSFLQSRMHAEGVVCSDCHEPHGARLRVEGNVLCAQCHLHARYDRTEHHHHAEGSAGAQCVACHMPSRTYMQVDERRDHGFRVPRPDLSARLGTPNACNDCHRDRPASWSAAAVDRWYGADRKATGWHWAEALHAGRTARADAEAQLVRALNEPKTPAIVRASALELLVPYVSPDSVGLVQAAVADRDPLVRRAAAAALVAVEPRARLERGLALLADPVRTVRFEALGAVVELRLSCDRPQRETLDRVIAEYRRSQSLDGDRAEAHANLGGLAIELGEPEAAERELREAMKLSPRFMPARVQLADLLGRAGRERDGEALLREGITLEPEVADLHAALGLSLVRQGRRKEALDVLARAADLAPDSSRNAYVLAVALHDDGELGRARAVLQRAHEHRPAERDLLVALIQYAIEAGDTGDARARAAELLALAPWDEETRRWLAQAEGK